MRGQATVAQMWAQMFHLLLGYPLRFGLYLFQEPTVSLVLCTSQSQRGDVLWINITLSWHWWNKEGKRQRYNIRVDANPRGRNLASFRDQQEHMIVGLSLLTCTCFVMCWNNTWKWLLIRSCLCEVGQLYSYHCFIYLWWCCNQWEAAFQKLLPMWKCFASCTNL